MRSIGGQASPCPALLRPVPLYTSDEQHNYAVPTIPSHLSRGLGCCGQSYCGCRARPADVCKLRRCWGERHVCLGLHPPGRPDKDSDAAAGGQQKGCHCCLRREGPGQERGRDCSLRGAIGCAGQAGVVHHSSPRALRSAQEARPRQQDIRHEWRAAVAFAYSYRRRLWRHGVLLLLSDRGLPCQDAGGRQTPQGSAAGVSRRVSRPAQDSQGRGSPGVLAGWRHHCFACDGGFGVADRDVRPGEGIAGPVCPGLPTASCGGRDLSPHLHHHLHAVRHRQDTCAAGKSRQETAIHGHLQRPCHHRQDGESGVPVDRIPALPAGQGNAYGHPLPHQGAIHGARQVAVLWGLEDDVRCKVVGRPFRMQILLSLLYGRVSAFTRRHC